MKKKTGAIEDQARRAAVQAGLRVAESFNDRSLKPLLAALASRMAQAGETVSEPALHEAALKGPDHVQSLINDFSKTAPKILTHEDVCRTLRSRDNEARIFLDLDRADPQAIAAYEGDKTELLLEAATQCHLPTIKFLHDSGIDHPGLYSAAGQVAAAKSRLDILEYLHTLKDLSKASPQTKESIVWQALLYGRIAAFKFLAKYEFDFFVHSFKTVENLSSGGHAPVLRWMFGKKMISAGSHGSAIFTNAMSHGRRNVLKLVLDEGYEPGDQEIAVSANIALSQLHFDVVSDLRKRGFKVTDPDNLAKSHPATAQELLRSALQAHNFKILRRLYRQGVRPDLGNQETRSAIGGAFVSGYMDMMAYMIDRGMDDTMFSRNPNCSAAWEEGIKRWRAWQRAGYRELPAKGLHLHTPHGYRHNVFMFAKNILVEEKHNNEQGDELAWQLMRLFGSEQRILQYMQRWGVWNKFGTQPLHDLAVNISIPESSDINTKAWGDAVLKFGPPMARYVKFADRLPRPCASLAKTRDLISKFAYVRSAENEELAKFCIEVAASEKQFEKALTLYQRQADESFPAKTIPDFKIDGTFFGMPGAVFRRLEPNDPRALFLGEYTGCCQSIDLTGEDCAIHGFTQPDSGFYVIENAQNEIIGQTWAWTGKNRELVLDSLEARNNSVPPQVWQSILQECGQQMRGNKNGYTGLLVGTGGKTPPLDQYPKVSGTEPHNYSSYRDSKAQYLVWSGLQKNPGRRAYCPAP